MSIQLQIEEKPGYLKARFIGAGATEEVERQFKSLAEQCKSSKKNKLLLDFTEVPSDISLVDRYELGKRTLVFAQYNTKKLTLIFAFIGARPMDKRGLKRL